jgi:hypothetical protein
MAGYRLAKCPICGYQAYIFKIPKDANEYAGCFSIGCNTRFTCQNNYKSMRMVYATKDEAAQAWNRIAEATKR